MSQDPLVRLKLAADELMAALEARQQALDAGDKAVARRADREVARCLAQPPLPRWLARQFSKCRVPEDQIDDCVQDVMMKLVTGRYAVRSSGLALLHRMARSVFLDRYDRSQAAKRAGHEVSLEGTPDGEEDAPSLLETVAAAGSDHGLTHELVDCVRKGFSAYQREQPDRATLLEMKAAGLSMKEIAAFVFDRDEDRITKNDEAATRDRVYQARKGAAPHLKPCLE
jgi:DNA-directed RNA polymerase specialized sigma24 family protein